MTPSPGVAFLKYINSSPIYARPRTWFVHPTHLKKQFFTRVQDPLNTIPLLLRCDDLAARDIISLIGECGSAKEVVMTVQEAAERLEHSLEREEDEDEDEKEGNHPKSTSHIDQFLILIDLYASGESDHILFKYISFRG